MSAFILYLHFSDEWHQFVSTEQIQGEGLIMSSQYSNEEMLQTEFFLRGGRRRVEFLETFKQEYLIPFCPLSIQHVADKYTKNEQQRGRRKGEELRNSK